MNLVIIGGNSAKKMSSVISTTFDDVVVLQYDNTDIFRSETVLRAIDMHRLILMQDGIDGVNDDNVYMFAEFLSTYYPMVRIITISKDKDMVVFFGDILHSPYAVHFHTETLKSKMVVDIVSCEVEEIKSRYKNMVYTKTYTPIINVVDEDDIVQTDSESLDMGGVAVQEKRGFFSKVLGLKPKERVRSVTKSQGLKPIGQGYGVSELTDQERTIFDTYGEDGELGVDYDGDADFYEDDDGQNETPMGFTMFDDQESDIGLGVGISQSAIDEEELEQEYTNDESLGVPNYSEDVFDEEVDFEQEEEVLGFEVHGLEDNELDLGLEDVEGLPLNRGFGLEELKESLQNTQVKKIGNQNKSKFTLTKELESVSDDLPLNIDNMEEMMKDYEKRKTKVIEVEKVVERVVTVEVDRGGSQDKRNRNGVKLIIVTGDRRTGVTRLAMNIANSFSKKEKTLYVDFDRYRKGALGYIGLDEFIDEPPHIQNGLNHLKNIKMLSNLTYLYRQGGFYTLLSMYGEEVEDAQIQVVQEIVSSQTDYTTVVIDCPLENMYLMTEILYTSNILICSEDNRVGVLNTIIELNTAVDNDTIMTALFNNSSFIVGGKSNIDRFKNELDYVVGLFGIDDTPKNWGNVHVLGTLRETKDLIGRL